MVATYVSRLRQVVADEEPPHQEEIGGAEHHLQPGGQAAVSLKEAELIERGLLFLFSLVGKRLLDGRTPAIWSVIGGQRDRREHSIMQELRQIVFELLSDRPITDQQHVVTDSFLEETIRQLGACLEVPFDVREPMTLFLAGPEGVGRSRKIFTDRLQLMFVPELEDRERRLVHGDVKDEDPLLLLHDRLEWFDIRIRIDGERVRHPRR